MLRREQPSLHQGRLRLSKLWRRFWGSVADSCQQAARGLPRRAPRANRSSPCWCGQVVITGLPLRVAAEDCDVLIARAGVCSVRVHGGSVRRVVAASRSGTYALATSARNIWGSSQRSYRLREQLAAIAHWRQQQPDEPGRSDAPVVVILFLGGRRYRWACRSECWKVSDWEQRWVGMVFNFLGAPCGLPRCNSPIAGGPSSPTRPRADSPASAAAPQRTGLWTRIAQGRVAVTVVDMAH